MLERQSNAGFTLIELSIVFVIIGLIIGAILLGENLISASRVRSQIAQIEEFRTAVNTFKLKYNYLPGDIPEPDASAIGLKARGTGGEQGDGNGKIRGRAGGSTGYGVLDGEAGAMWVDLSTTNLIKAGLNTASPTDTTSSVATTYGIAAILPEAKIGRGNYVYVTHGGMVLSGAATTFGSDGFNYFSISNNTAPVVGTWGMNSTPGMTPNEAYNMDTKLDDGYPQSGRVIAGYVNYAVQNYALVWAAGGGNQGAGTSTYNASPSTAATAPSATTCFDNSNSSGTKMSYSLTSQSDGFNCALSFRF